MDGSSSSYNGGVAAVNNSQASDSRYSVGFPLGTALLLLVIFSLSGVFSCCFHWDKLRRAFLRRPTTLEADHAHHVPALMDLKRRENKGLPVIVMPGDNVPKFIAVPSPCLPPRLDKVTVEAPPPPPPKPLQVRPTLGFR